jgi:hypothetical protein
MPRPPDDVTVETPYGAATMPLSAPHLSTLLERITRAIRTRAPDALDELATWVSYQPPRRPQLTAEETRMQQREDHAVD